MGRVIDSHARTGLADLDRQIADLHVLPSTVAELRAAAATVDPASCDSATVCRHL